MYVFSVVPVSVIAHKNQTSFFFEIITTYSTRKKKKKTYSELSLVAIAKTFCFFFAKSILFRNATTMTLDLKVACGTDEILILAGGLRVQKN
jgi:hypothetical protein